MHRWIDVKFTLVAIFLWLALVAIAQEAHVHLETVSEVLIDCYPQPGITQELCEVRGCTWKQNDTELLNNEPQCYYPPNSGYISETYTEGMVTLKKSPASIANPYGPDFEKLSFTYEEIGAGMKIRISPEGVKRFTPPVPLDKHPNIQSKEKLKIKFQDSSIFSFSIIRESTGTKIWDTSIGGLHFADQFIQIATLLPTEKIYGFGENVHQSIKHDFSKYTTWGMFARDEAPSSHFNNTHNLYGVHPFYMALEKDGKAHGVFILNSAAQEITTGPGPHMIYRTIGGELEIFYFPGPKPEDVIKQYEQVIGKPMLPAYWALGFQLCRWGYQGLEDVKQVVERTRRSGIPFDVQYADIDYMDRYKDFTLDYEKWADLPEYTNYLHENGMHLILIFDPAIQVDDTSFARAKEQNVAFIEWPRRDLVPSETQEKYTLVNNTNIMLGVVWPDRHVAFPDFLDQTSSTDEWWANELALYHTKVPYDGIWIDMNEPANFGTNEQTPWYFYNDDHPNVEPLHCPTTGPDSGLDVPPYQTVNVYQWPENSYLSTKTLCMVASTMRGQARFYDTKNLYGWSESVATHKAMRRATGKRGAIISRSTFPSSGRYAGHWLGDNHAKWDDLRTTIIGVQEFNMFGIPYVGSDICGFSGYTTEELCLRWQQLGAFHSFSRNHQDWNGTAQDPAMWPSVAHAARKANLFRYRHLPYLFSLHFAASLHGGTVIRPPFFEYPHDEETHNLSYQFLWGPSLMIAPVIEPGVDSVRAYLPKESQWYSVYDYSYGQLQPSGYETYPAPTEYLISVFVRGGYILPRQRAGMTTSESRKNELQLLIALEMTSDSVDAARKVAAQKSNKWKRSPKKGTSESSDLPPTFKKHHNQDNQEESKKPAARTHTCDIDKPGPSSRNDTNLPAALQGLQRPRSQTLPDSFLSGEEDHFLFPMADVSAELKNTIMDENQENAEELSYDALNEVNETLGHSYGDLQKANTLCSKSKIAKIHKLDVHETSDGIFECATSATIDELPYGSSSGTSEVENQVSSSDMEAQQLAYDAKTETSTTAHGELYWDDGESIIDDFTTYNYHHWEFTFTLSKNKAVLNITQTRTATSLHVPTLDNIEIFGYQYTPDLSTVKLNDQPVPVDMKQTTYDPATKILNMTATGLIDLNSGTKFLLSWTNLGVETQSQAMNNPLDSNNLAKKL